MTRKVVAIHQPNFFPWLGFFDKIRRADVFIFMDNVQFPSKSRGTVVNGVQICIADRPTRITMPVKKNYHGHRTIAQMEVHDDLPWRTKFVATLQANYGKAPFFAQTMEFLEPLIFFKTSSLSAFNINAITAIASLAGWEKKLILGTSLKTEGNATELLISMTKAVDGTAYLCGGGAAGYQNDSLFDEAGVELVYQNFRHPLYPQHKVNEFMAGLSIVDVMMNTGLDGWIEVLDSSYGAGRA